ncbi:4'-phosphopantetheinyl transferase family protein [Actinacidiphila sp. bgisy145]|uniref:4'-phosphopantetheinyl transferase family protein n=1 Tax=Actinacidiphila sp. bgisy145 TaxID=3413792 RepID=UPI003EBF0D0F
MLEQVLPEPVAVVEALGDDETAHLALYPQEAALVAKAVDRRRREFATVRACARRAMVKLGVPPQAVPTGQGGAPCWPEGLRGSMTHCAGYRAAALVRAADLASLGIDAEPHAPLPHGVLRTVSLPAERQRLAALAARRPDVHWDLLLFSAKESVYKAWFPLTGRWLGFEEADVEADIDVRAPAGDAAQGRFRAELLVPGPVVGGRRLQHFEGRWIVGGGVAATAVTVPHP